MVRLFFIEPGLQVLYSGGYMFPDLEKSDVAGGAVGIIIPETVTDADREIFESILTELTTAFKIVFTLEYFCDSSRERNRPTSAS